MAHGVTLVRWRLLICVETCYLCWSSFSNLPRLWWRPGGSKCDLAGTYVPTKVLSSQLWLGISPLILLLFVLITWCGCLWRLSLIVYLLPKIHSSIILVHHFMVFGRPDEPVRPLAGTSCLMFVPAQDMPLFGYFHLLSVLLSKRYSVIVPHFKLVPGCSSDSKEPCALWVGHVRDPGVFPHGSLLLWQLRWPCFLPQGQRVRSVSQEWFMFVFKWFFCCVREVFTLSVLYLFCRQ